jgi:hypothetical protein
VQVCKLIAIIYNIFIIFVENRLEKAAFLPLSKEIKKGGHYGIVTTF